MADWRRYDDLKVGDIFPPEPVRFAVTPEVVAEYRAISASSLAGQNPVGPDDADSVPPMLAAVYIRGAQNALKGPPGGIHAKQHFTFLAPVRIGDELATQLTVAEKFERKGRRYVVLDTLTRNGSGQDVTRGRITSIWGQET